MLDPLIKNHVTVTGNVNAGRTLVFVHGFGTDQTVWCHLVEAFAKDYRIVLLDNVGAGRSLPEAFVQHRYLNLQGYVQDLLAVLDALQIRECTCVGHSVGAMIVVLASLRAPHRITRLVLIGASPRYLDDVGYVGGFNDEGLDALYSALQSDYAAWADEFAPAMMARPEQPDLGVYFASCIKTIPSTLALTVLCSIFQSDHRRDIARITVPTLLIQTRIDPVVPQEVADYMHATIPGSLLRVIDTQGHLPHVSAPADVIAAIQDFV